MRKLLTLYIVFGALAIVTIGFALFVSRRAISGQRGSVVAARQSMIRHRAIGLLHKRASAVDSALDRVIQTRDVATASRNFEAAASAFNGAMRQMQPQVVSGLPEKERRRVQESLRNVGARMHHLEAEVRQTVASVASGHAVQAAARSGSVDRDFALLRNDLSSISAVVRAVREEELRRDANKAVVLWRSQQIAAFLLVIVIASIIFYGWRMQRQTVVIDDLYRREEELRRANAAFENAMSGVAFIDADGRFAFVSRPFARVFGSTPAEMIGVVPATLVLAEDRDILAAANDELRATGRNEVELRVQHKSGPPRDVKFIRVASRDDAGNRLGHYTFANDITEQRCAEGALRRSEARLNLAARASRSLIFEADLNTDRAWVNDAMQEQFGVPASGDVDGSVWADRVHPEDRARVIADRDEAIARGDQFWSTEYRFQRGDGTWADVESHVSVVRDGSGEPIRIIGATTDVSERNRATAALRKSEERFTLATQATSDVIFEWDVHTNACWVNEKWQTQFGHSAWGETDRSEWFENVHPNDRDAVVRTIRTALDSADSVWSHEYRLRRGDGTYASVASKAYIVRDAGGNALRAVGSMTDVTERKREERARTNQLLNSAADAIVGMDLDARVTFINASARQLLGCTAERTEGVDLHSLVHRDGDGNTHEWAVCPLREDLLAGRRSKSERERLRRRDGSFVEVEFQLSPVRGSDGGIVGAVVTARDITERLAVERMKDEFVSIVSHELRTPLTSIRGALGLLAGNRVGDLPDKAKRMLDIALTNTDRLVRLINDILDIERMESGKITLNKQLRDVRSVISQAAELMRPMAEKSGIHIECIPCDGMVHADPDRLAQTLTNLISNAVKFSPPASTITLSARKRDGAIELEVRDQGRGIPADKLELIFERFQQIDASDSREKGGSGLGLAICRSIVHQHGGEIRALSVPGEGSRFVFTIPHDVGTANAVPQHGPTIMVCDDDEMVRQSTVMLLQQCGYRAVAVSSGEELLQRVQAVAPDAVLLDFMSPGMRGDETLMHLKTNPRTASIPVFIMSAFSREDVEFTVDGLAGWIQKPADAETIVGEIELALQTAAPPRVLLVEDDDDLSRVIEEGFARHGVRTIRARCGRAAIEEAKTMTPDLLILDIGLPDIDGYAVVDWLKDHDKLRTVPVVVYSASEPSPSQRERLTLGPTEFLTKSRVAPEEFDRRVIALLDSVTGSRLRTSHVA